MLLRSRVLLLNAAKLFNLQRPVAHHLIPKYIKSILLGDLIVQSGKSLFLFLFYVWDWLSLGGLFIMIVVCVLIIVDSPLLSSMSLTFPMLASISMEIGDKLFGIEQQPQSWFINISSNIWGGLCTVNHYLYVGSVFTFKYSMYMVYYPFKFVIISWGHVKTIITLSVFSFIALVTSKAYMIWNEIIGTATSLFTLAPFLPNWFIIFVSGVHHVILIPLQDLITQPGNVLLNLILSPRNVIQLFVNLGTITNDVILNYVIETYREAMNFHFVTVRIGVRLMFLPIFLCIKNQLMDLIWFSGLFHSPKGGVGFNLF
jgi:hypothetical protein